MGSPFQEGWKRMRKESTKYVCRVGGGGLSEVIADGFSLPVLPHKRSPMKMKHWRQEQRGECLRWPLWGIVQTVTWETQDCQYVLKTWFKSYSNTQMSILLKTLGQYKCDSIKGAGGVGQWLRDGKQWETRNEATREDRQTGACSLDDQGLQGKEASWN